MKIPVFKILKYSKRGTIFAAVGAVVVLLGGTSALAAKSNALPGSPLYPFKQLWEGGQMMFSFSQTSKAQTQVGIAQDRIRSAQAVVSQTPAATNGSNALTALEQAQLHLKDALSNAKEVSDSSQRKEVDKSISDAALEAEKEIEAEKQAETSNTDKQSLQNTSDQIQQIQTQASTDD